ncbi:MAG: metal ABC transporter ATP-binding protein [Gammaproteobacteria bacterium]
MDKVIHMEGVGFAYNKVSVVKDITLDVLDGEFLGIIGPNAGGKSTLVKLMLGLLAPDEGTIKIYGQAPVYGRSRIGYVPQYASFSRDFPINVTDTVLMGRLGRTKWFGGYQARDREIALKAMQVVEIESIGKQNIGSLSGGQLQRVLIARALASEPKILILDEPTSNIDVRVEEEIFSLLKQYNDHMTIIVVSHDIAFISGYVDRVACLNQTLVCHETEAISGKTIEELYGAPVRMIQHAH